MDVETILEDIIIIGNKKLSPKSQNKYKYAIKKILEFIGDDYDNFYDLERVNDLLKEYYSHEGYMFAIRMCVEMLKVRIDDYEDIYDLYLELKTSLLKERKR